MYIPANLMMPAYDASVQATPPRFDARVSFVRVRPHRVLFTPRDNQRYRIGCAAFSNKTKAWSPLFLVWGGLEVTGKDGEGKVGCATGAGVRCERAEYACEKRRQGQDVNMWKQGWQIASSVSVAQSGAQFPAQSSPEARPRPPGGDFEILQMAVRIATVRLDTHVSMAQTAPFPFYKSRSGFCKS